MSLWQENINNTGKLINKWSHYFPIYERHFSRWRNLSIVFWEIGVYEGGSLAMWQKYFGPNAIIVGIDINPQCKRHEAPGIHVRIGSQDDTAFLQSVIDEFGAPDVVLDDASHLMKETWATFEFVYPKVSKNGVYLVEDMHTSYWPDWGGGIDKPDAFINCAKRLIDELNADHTRGALAPTTFTRTTQSIAFYDSVVAFEKGAPALRQSMRTGGAAMMPVAISLKARQSGGRIRAVCDVVGGAAPAGTRYAFYLLVDGQAVEKRGYKPGRKAEFEVPKAVGSLSVRVFLRGADGSISKSTALVTSE